MSEVMRESKFMREKKMCKGLRTPRWKQSEYRIKIQGVRFASERFYQGDGVINGYSN